MHSLGANFNGVAIQDFQEFVKNNTGLTVHSIDAFNGGDSFLPIDLQVPVILRKVKRIVATEKYDKVIAVGHSQGGVIWRGVIERWHNHNVDTFIGLATPQHGVANIPLQVLDYMVDNVINDKDLDAKIEENLEDPFYHSFL